MAVPNDRQGRDGLRVVHCTALPLGGAGRFARRLHRQLREMGIDSYLLVAFGEEDRASEQHDDDGIITRRSWRGRIARIWAPNLDQFPLRFYHNRQQRDFTPSWIGSWFRRQCHQLRPDVVHLHWCGAGALRLETLSRFPRPLVWTLHDRWVHTGGCHFPEACRRFTGGCGRCPILGSDREEDLSRKNYRRKERAYRITPFTPVALSEEAATMVRAAPLMAGHEPQIIPNGIDTKIFFPGDRLAARRALGMDLESTVIGFGSVRAGVDPRKGCDLFCEALARLPTDRPWMVVSFGGTMPALPLPCIDFGVVTDDEQLVKIYRACDVFVIASREEGLPTTALEAQACGVPVAAYAIGGCIAALVDGETGHLATPFDPTALAQAIIRCVKDREAIGVAARRRIEALFTMKRIAILYRNLYRKLVD